MNKKYPTDDVLDQYRERLKNIVEKKFTTTMIFALSEFEKGYGNLWGHGKKNRDKTPEEMGMFKIWQEVRTSILNNGNKQKRGFMNELDMHDVIWNRYHATFTPINKEIE